MANEPRVQNAADENQVREAEKKAKRSAQRDLEDVSWVLSTRQGRRFYLRYIEMCGVYRTSMDSGGSMNRTFFNEGERNIGLRLLADLERVNPEAYILMKKESKEE